MEFKRYIQRGQWPEISFSEIPNPQTDTKADALADHLRDMLRDSGIGIAHQDNKTMIDKPKWHYYCAGHCVDSDQKGKLHRNGNSDRTN